MVNPGFGRELYSIRNADPQGEVPYRCTRPDKSGMVWSSDGSEVSRFQPDKSDAVSKSDTVLEFWSED